MSEPFYITTAIAYPNGKPHIGHAYEAIATDAIARFQRLMGRDVCFLTGTDEHGLKMDQTARAAGKATIELADEMSAYFMDLCAELNISADHFRRTTSDHHHKASKAMWKRLEASGDLYLDRYEGWYSVRDEAFYDEKELIAGEGEVRLSPQGTPVEWTTEETWFFRLSKYEKQLLELYEKQPDFIRPESRRNETIRFVEGGLRDLSVSRTSFDWGVKVPGSEDHVMYVWLDALTTYISGIGFPDNTDEWRKYWPASLHIIGKDIVRFHAVYWPALLMSAGLPLPKQIFGHGFLLSRGEKMSKSLGNVVDPMELAKVFGVDALRYFLLREVSFGQDGSYSAEAIVTRVNAELANSFGNLAQRTLSLIFKNCDGYLPAIKRDDEADNELLDIVGTAVCKQLPEAFEALAMSQGLESWMNAVFACNAYVDSQAPWALKKTDPERMETVLATLFICIAQLAVAVLPVIPASAERLLDQMGIPADVRNFAAIGVKLVFTTGRERLPDRATSRPVSASGNAGRGSRLMLVDSHCHLNYKGLVEQQSDVLARARENGVSAMLNISTRESEWDEVIGLAEQEADVWASVGIHPHEADGHSGVDANKLIERAQNPRVIGIGETGLDYYYDKSDRARQRSSFRDHIVAARATGLPIIVHTRDAENDTAQMLLEEMALGAYSGVIHCFTASAEFARTALDLGLYISLSGIVTFKNAADLQEIAKWLPTDRILVETDSPFLAPVPHRGRTGEPGFVADTARFVASLRGEGADALAAQTTANFYRLFSKAVR